MAYACNGTQFLRTTPQTMFTYPFTINCWFYLNTVSAQRNLVLLHNTGDAFRFALLTNASNQLVLAAVDSGGTTQTALTAATVSANTWYMATGVFTSATSRTVYLNAANGTTGTVSRTPTTPTRVLLGAQYTGTTSANLNGSIAEVAIWDAALTTAEISSLYTTTKASLIRPANLQIYYPLVREVVNHTGTQTINDNTGTVGVHYRRYG